MIRSCKISDIEVSSSVTWMTGTRQVMNISSSFDFIEGFLGQTPAEMMAMSSSEATLSEAYLNGGGLVSHSKQQENNIGDSENTGNLAQAVSSLWMILYFTMLNFIYKICLRYL